MARDVQHVAESGLGRRLYAGSWYRLRPQRHLVVKPDTNPHSLLRLCSTLLLVSWFLNIFIEYLQTILFFQIFQLIM